MTRHKSARKKKYYLGSTHFTYCKVLYLKSLSIFNTKKMTSQDLFQVIIDSCQLQYNQLDFFQVEIIIYAITNS